VLIYTGRTVHVIPGEEGTWNVVDLQRRASSFRSKAAAVEHAKHIAATNQPSQVVLFDAFGRVEPIAHFQLPEYQLPQADQDPPSIFEATAKALLIGGLAAAGVAVLGDLVDRVEREADRESARSRRKPKRAGRHRAA
jgi:hypothetical protein